MTKTMYILAGTGSYNGGTISMADFNMSQYCEDKTLICTQEVEFDVPEFDIVNLQIDGIDKKIAKIRAAAQMEVNGLEQRKQELLAIGHEVTA